MDTSPFAWLPRPTLPPPPAWWLDALRNRLVLLLNHVLQQEREAQQRLRRQAGKVVEVQAPGLLPPGWAAAWGAGLRLQVTPAGLLAVAPSDAPPDLTLTLQETGVATLAQRALAGQRPAVAIAGDVQLAAEVAWLIDHVRWDAEEDLARWIGDAAAHTLMQGLRQLAAAVRLHVLPRLQTLAQRAAAGRPAPADAGGDGAAV